FISPTYVPEYSPYISSIPVELYGQLAMQKQQQYDTGLQRVQSFVQNITGLEMDRDIDQAYNEQKVGEFRKNIENILSEDLSDTNGLMQAGAYSSQLFNDKRIRNSVLSRIHEKDAYKQLEQAQQDGTYAPENAELLLSQINAWKSGDENAVLGKQTYIPYDNYMERYQKWMKNVAPDVRLDQHSPIDADGNPIPYVLVEGKVEAITDDKISAAHEAFFQQDASARQQRSSSTRDYASQISDADALSALQRANKEENESIDKQIEFYQQQMVLYGADQQQVKQFKKNIEQLTANKEKLNENYQNEVSLLASNPIQVKANLYDRQQRRQLVNMFTYKKESSKMVKNPMFEAMLDYEQFLEKN